MFTSNYANLKKIIPRWHLDISTGNPSLCRQGDIRTPFVATIADVRDLVHKRLPPSYKSKQVWKRVAVITAAAARGELPAEEVTVALKLVLAIDNPAGPKGYNVAEKADVTVVLYKERKVEANYSFEKGALSEKDVDTIVADVKKITK